MVNDTTSVIPEWKKIQDGFSTEGLEFVFRELLGWGLEIPKVLPCVIGEESFSPHVVADLKGYRVFLFETPSLPSPKMQAQIDAKLSLQAPERITIFSDGEILQWRWPHQTPSGGVSYESLSISASKMPSFLAQRLVGLRFTVQDFTKGVSLVDVRDRVRGRFDGAKVTKKFFDEFRKHHQHLAGSIEGLEVEEDRSAYATLLMNRLMLLYFLQKREFLNDDPFYLENCLKQVQQSKGQDKFYSFYRDLLLPMFFDRLAAFAPKKLDPEVARIIGDIPYINGGIYEPSPLEKEFGGELNVPDEVFEIVLGFFGKFNWHLDTRPSGSENEINPEVIGYIFEQYINYTAGGKKDNGAYYTKEDVTGYMVGNTLIPRILDYCAELEIPFLDLVVENPLRYIHTDMLHGYELETKTWLPAPTRLEEVWADDPIHWHELDDADSDAQINLSGESWVETFYRRERVERLAKELSEGLVIEVNDLITHNLNSRLLLNDAIDRLDNLEIATVLWAKVTSLSVLDPTCGSGAFLFAAMEALEDVYHHLIDVMRTDQSKSGTAREIVDEIERHPNDRYFVRKSIALNNLYGTDLMPDAIETAQLRIFLALVSCLEHKSDVEPLPDLDFNLKCGNLLVGLKDPQDLERFGGDLISQLALSELRPQLEVYDRLYSEFVTASKIGNQAEVAELRSDLEKLIESLRAAANTIFLPIGAVAEQISQDWLDANRPFHWFIEFPEIIEQGGFDVVIGNPPYVSRTNLTLEQKRQLEQYETGQCPDIYAACFERSLQLVKNSGRHAFIVALNLVFGNKFEALRKIVSKRGGSEWWSSYGSFAGGLFSGIEIRNVILILANGRGNFASHHNGFSVETRPRVFGLLEYHGSTREGSENPLRSGVPLGLAEKLRRLEKEASISSERHVRSGQSVFLRPTAGYWFPVVPRMSPIFNEDFSIQYPSDPRLKEVSLSKNENWFLTLAALGGKLGYYWWFVTGDNFDVNPRETDAVRALASEAQNQDDAVAKLAERVFLAIPEATVFISHKGVRPNIRWSDLAKYTDPLDREILTLVGLESEWRDLNIWYRQAMKSSGPSPKDRPPPMELRRIFAKKP